MSLPPVTHGENGEYSGTQCAPILRLPQELLEFIAGFISPPTSSGLLKFSSTCKELRIRLALLVGAAYFSRRAFFIADELSMNALLGISSHSVFSKSMQHIELSLAKIVDWTKPHSKIHRSDICTERNKDSGDRRISSENEYRARDVFEERSTGKYTKCKVLLRSQDDFLGNTASVYIWKILRNFKAAGSTPSLAIHGDDLEDLQSRKRDRDTPTRLRRLVKKIPDDDGGYEIAIEMCDERPFDYLYDAIRRTEYPITHLELGDKNIGICLFTSGFLHLRGHALAHLKTLKLAVEMIDVVKEHLLIRLIDNLPRLIDVLRIPRSLETLVLTTADSNFYIDSDSMVFEAVSKEVASPDEQRALRNIRELEFCQFCFEAVDLLAFVRSTRNTLRRLVIGDTNDMLSTYGRDAGARWSKAFREAYGGDSLELVGSVWTMEGCAQCGMDDCDCIDAFDEGDRLY